MLVWLKVLISDHFLGQQVAVQFMKATVKDGEYFFTPSFSIPINEWQPLTNPFHFFIVRTEAEEKGMEWNPNMNKRAFLKQALSSLKKTKNSTTSHKALLKESYQS